MKPIVSNSVTNNSSSDDSPSFRSRLWTWFWRISLLAFGLLVGIGGPYVWKLDKEVREQFAELEWQEPTRVYARPLLLSDGVRLSPESFELELTASGYVKDGVGQIPGAYRREGNQFWLRTRDFADLDGTVRSKKLKVVLQDNAVASVTNIDTNTRLSVARIDPSRIATLYGNAEEERRLVRLEEVPPLMVTGLQAVEDRNFKNHFGIDFRGLLRAIWVNIREGEYQQGASTITQQMVRSCFLSNTKTISRKVKEAMYSLIIEARFDKKTILEAYLNQAYLGQQGNQSVHGIAAGSEFWFGRDLKSLRTEEMALLIGVIQGPAYWEPRKHPERAKIRRATVLQVWKELGLISAEEAARANAAPLGVSAKPGVAKNRNPAFMDLVRRQLARDYPADTLKGAGMTVHTSLAPSVQLMSEKAVIDTLAKIQRAQGPALQSGMVVTNSNSGEVLAMVGSKQVDQPGFNRALEAQRPVGSLLKPFVFLLALAQPDRYSLASFVDDGPVEVTQPNGKTWRPGNSDGQSHGMVTMTTALAQSYNQATVRVGMDVGPDRLSELMKVLGGLQSEPRPSLILGSVDLSVFSMAQMYQFLASGGRIQPLRSVRGVLDPKGKIVNRYDFESEAAQEGDAIAARLVTLGLQQAVSSGTGKSLLTDGLGPLQAAGKTGTSNDGRDSWFAGYTGDHLAVVWVGNDENKTTGLYGATGAMKVWSSLFKKLPTRELKVAPQGIEWAWIDSSEFATTEENCPNARRAAFVAGYAPKDHKSCADGSWLDWFKLGNDAPEEMPAPPGDNEEQQ
jgi:penicillin-binding protein 1B